MFGFEPNTAAVNLLALLKYFVLIAGVCSTIGFLFKGKGGLTIASILITAFLYYTLDVNGMGALGESIAKTLTITQPATTTQTNTTNITPTATATTTPETTPVGP